MPRPSQSWLLLFMLLSAMGRVRLDAVVINEILYRPPSGKDSLAFVELHNPAAQVVDLEGWELTAGVRYRFPRVLLPPGGFVVVVADRAAFATAHPGVTNVVGDWSGRLSYNGEAIELKDRLGRRVCTVSYSTEGDWAQRSEGPLNHGHRGLIWTAAHNGAGMSLELVDPALPVGSGQNWASSMLPGGTPGRTNSTSSSRSPPLVVEAAHEPPSPTSSQPIRFTARLQARPGSISRIFLHHRLDTAVPGPFEVLELKDDGAHEDGAAGDGLFGAVVPPRPNLAVMEYFFQAATAEGRVRSWPSPTLLTGGTEVPQANCLLQVNDAPTDPTLPIYRLALRAADAAELALIGSQSPDSLSSAQFNATLVTTAGGETQVRHRLGVRHRGHGSRGKQPNSVRINFLQTEPWQGVSAIDLNAPYSYVHVLGNAFCALAGLEAPFSQLATVRLNGRDPSLDGGLVATYGHYAAVEVMNADFARRHFPNDPEGNLYRGIASDDTTQEADFRYLGPDPLPYRPVYFKQTNEREDAWADLIALCETLSPSGAPTAESIIAAHIDVEQWIRYLAVMAFLDNRETSPNTGNGDDFALYQGVEDRRFQLLPYDTDTVFGLGFPSGAPDATLLGSLRIPALDRFLSHPTRARMFVNTLRQLAERTFAPDRAFALIDQLLADHVPTPVLDRVKTFITARATEVQRQYPSRLSATSALPLADGAHQAPPGLQETDLSGRFDAGRTAEVRVNGQPARLEPLRSAWTLPRLEVHTGLNPVLVVAYDAHGKEIDRASLRIQSGEPAGIVAGPVTGATRWTSANGPIRILHPLIIPRGSSLTLEPGVTLRFASNATLRVEGELQAHGTEIAPVRIELEPEARATWPGLTFTNPDATSLLQHTQFPVSVARRPMISVQRSQLQLDHVQFQPSAGGCIEAWNSSLTARDCQFPAASPDAATLVCIGPPSTGPGIRVERCLFDSARDAGDAIQLKGVRGHSLLPQFIDNRFLGGADDALELQSSEAYLEGNTLERYRSVIARRDPSAGIELGGGSVAFLARNLIAGNDVGAVISPGSTLTSEHTTWVGQGVAAVQLQPPDAPEPARGRIHSTHDIFWANTRLLPPDLTSPAPSTFIVRRSLLPPDAGITGADVIHADPGFVPRDPTYALRTDSPARRRSPLGLDLGWRVPRWAVVAGLPVDRIPATTVHLRLGGAGITRIRWSLDDAPFTGPHPSDQLVTLSGLSPGPHALSVLGLNAAGEWQPLTQPTRPAAWIVDPTVSPIIISEVLAANTDPALGGPELPDAVELFNRSDTPIRLEGLSLTDTLAEPRRYAFGSAATLDPGEFLVLLSSRGSSSRNPILGFGLDRSGDALFLVQDSPQGPRVLDQVVFGHQLPGSSIGRMADGGWQLNRPTLGSPNEAIGLGDPHRIRINEWALGSSAQPRDRIELFNPDFRPVLLSGLSLADHGGPDPWTFPPLSFIAGHGFDTWSSATTREPDPGRFNFRLNPRGGTLRLRLGATTDVDTVIYHNPRAGAAQGRSPDGAFTVLDFPAASPGASNPGELEIITRTNLLLLSITNRWRYHAAGGDPGTGWAALDFDDQNRPWASGRAPFQLGPVANAAAPANTLLLPARPPQTSLFFRTLFKLPPLQGDLSLNLSHILDDGAVVYLNGQELYRFNLPPGPITPRSAALAAIGTPTRIGPLSLPAPGLIPGDNLLAVEVHQAATGDEDLFFALELEAVAATSSVVHQSPHVDLPSDEPRQDHAGQLSGLHVWSAQQGIHEIVGDLHLLPGAELRIEAGSRLRLAPGVSIRSDNARISLLGTEAFPILVEPLREGRPWGELSVTGPHGELQVAQADIAGGMIRIMNGAVGSLEDSRLHEYTEEIFPILEAEDGGSLLLRRCHIHHYNEVHITSTPVIIEGCLFEFPRIDGLDLDHLPEGSVVRDSTLRNGIGENIDGIDFGTDSHGLIERCVIHGFTDKGISVGDASRNIRIRHTLVHSAGNGIALKDSSSVVLDHVTLTRCGTGLLLFEKNTGLGGGFASVANSILWENGLAFEHGAGSSAEFLHCNTDSPTPPEGITNTRVPPGFTAPDQGDYQLPPTSPLSQAGTDGLPLGPVFPVGGVPPTPNARVGEWTADGRPRIHWNGTFPPDTRFRIDRRAPPADWEPVALLTAEARGFFPPAIPGETPVSYDYRIQARSGTGLASPFVRIEPPIHKDRDGDGLPDTWESIHGLDPQTPADAAEDADADGASNATEYLAGTDPQDARDLLRLGGEPTADGRLRLRFVAVPGRRYSIQFRDQLDAGAWLPAGSWPASGERVTVELPIDTTPTASRFFRLLSE